MHRFLIDGARVGGTVEIRGGALRHLRTVLRLRPGERVELFDGAGGGFLGEIHAVDPTVARIAVVTEIAVDRESPLALTLAVALSRGSKLDWIVEKATELGVARVIPFRSERSAPEPGAPARRGRWERLAAAAARQSGRATRPMVDPVRPFAEVLAARRDHDLGLLFYENANGFPEELRHGRPRSVLAVTGPEGGFTDGEARAAADAGFDLVGLGPRTLRAETAGMVAVAMCQALWGDLFGSSR